MSTPMEAGIRRVPPEILSEIFIHCLPMDSALQNTQRVLSSVCRLWRALALATPALWASLNIICDHHLLRPPLPVIHTYLQRSQTHPLSFTLCADDSKYLFETNPNFRPVLTALATARRRWRNINIKLLWMTQDILDLIMLSGAPLLESIRCDASRFSQNLPIPLRMLHHCPRLESFQWHSVRSPLLLPLVDTPLTSVSLDTALSVSDCIALLRLSPRLSSAKFHSLYDHNPRSTPHLTHSTLRALAAAGGHCTTLLDALTLPSLVDLDLIIGETRPPLPIRWEVALPAFLGRNNSVLHQLSLSIAHPGGGESTLLRILALAPRLHSLKLTEGPSNTLPFSDALIRALHPPPPPGTPLCPHLQRLQLSRVEKCPNGMCSAMLRARWGAQAHANKVASLEWVQIEIEDGMRDRDQAEMKELYAEGMQGGIVYWNRSDEYQAMPVA